MYSLDLKLVWEIVVTLLSLLATVGTWIAWRSKRDGISEESSRNILSRLTGVETATKKHDGQIKDVETQLATVPTREELRLIGVEIGNVRTQVAEVSGQLRGVTHSLNLINEHLINRSGK